MSEPGVPEIVLGQGAEHKVTARSKSSYARVQSHAEFPVAMAQSETDRERENRQRCVAFFKAIPGLLPRERWLPVGKTESEFARIRSVRDRVVPYRDTLKESSLGEGGLAQKDLTETMRQELSQVLECSKSGVLKAIVAGEGKTGEVPDLRGENFLFNREGHLRFIDTSGLELCGLREGGSMNDGLKSVIYKLALIEKRVLGRTGNELWNDVFYEAATRKFRDMVGDIKAKEYFGQLFIDKDNTDIHKVQDLDEILPILNPQEAEDLSLRVTMGKLAISDRAADKAVLSTPALASCIGVSGYDQEYGIGFLAHLSPNTDASLAKKVIKKELSARYPGARLNLRTTLVYSSAKDIHLLGGWKDVDSEPVSDGIIFTPDREIEFDFDINKLIAEKRQGPSDGFALNLKDGTIYAYRPQYISLDEENNISLPLK